VKYNKQEKNKEKAKKNNEHRGTMYM